MGIYDGPHATPKKTVTGPVYLGISSLNRGQLDRSAFEFISEEDFEKWTKRVVPQAGDVVFSYETRLGEVALIPVGLRCCLGRRMALMRIDRGKALPEFVVYAFLAPAFHEVIRARTIHGSTVDRLPLTEFGSFPITLPPLDVQYEVVGTLRAFDDRVALLREANSTLEAIAQALFKSWFVDFDPVRAKQRGVAPTGMDEATAALFPDSFEDSALGPVPNRWQIRPLSELCESVFSGGTPDTRRSEFWSGDLRWFSSGETREVVIIETEKRINALAVQNSSTRLAKPGDVLIASAGQGHTRGQTAYCAIETYINQSVVSVRTDTAKGHAAWTFYNLARRYDEMRMLSDSHSIRGSLTTKMLASMRVLCPSPHLVQRFGCLVSPMLAAQAENRRRAATIATLRDTLLPRLISGQLRLPQAEGMLAEA